MNFLRVQIRLFGMFSIFFSFLLFLVYIVSLIYSDQCTKIFFVTSVLVFFFGYIEFLLNRNVSLKFNKNNILIMIIFFWIFIGTLSALPLILLKDMFKISITDAFFESISCLTTTGSTIFVNFDILPKSILFYRQILQWIGGIDINIILLIIFFVIKKNITYILKFFFYLFKIKIYI